MCQDLSDTLVYKLDSPLLTKSMLAKSLHVSEHTASTVLRTLLEREEITEVQPGVYLRQARPPMLSLAATIQRSELPIAPAAQDGLWSDPDDLTLEEPLPRPRPTVRPAWVLPTALVGGVLTGILLLSQLGLGVLLG